MGKFEVGHEKVGGKVKGSVNKVTRDIREVISYIISSFDNGSMDDMIETLKAKNPTALMNFIAKVAPKDVTLHKGNDTTTLTDDKLNKLTVSERKQLLTLIDKMEG